MPTSDYTVEFDGMNYVVLKCGQFLSAFVDADSAYAAKRAFSDKRLPENWQKVPPAMRFAKQKLYGHTVPA